jgi:hypothetical protein
LRFCVAKLEFKVLLSIENQLGEKIDAEERVFARNPYLRGDSPFCAGRLRET